MPPVATQVANCAVTGTAYNDSDGDGVRDVAETGRAGVVAYVDYNGDGDP